MGFVKIVVDSSALVAIAVNEPEREPFVRTITDATEALCSAVTLYETGIVLIRKKLEAHSGHALSLVRALGLRVIPFTGEQAALALDAYRRFGKGLGRRPFLNLGDCVAYALARSLDAPLLFKGDDFHATDVQPVT
jgi:ribonuclease VapC